jgi:hypothetical protein
VETPEAHKVGTGLVLASPDDRMHAAVSPYQDLEKATVLQECRVFHDANVVTQNPRLCCQLITKLLHIITQVRRGISYIYRQSHHTASLYLQRPLHAHHEALLTPPEAHLVPFLSSAG